MTSAESQCPVVSTIRHHRGIFIFKTSEYGIGTPVVALGPSDDGIGDWFGLGVCEGLGSDGLGPDGLGTSDVTPNGARQS